MTAADSSLSLDALTDALYQELRKIAHRERLRAGKPMTLQTTALVSESYLKLRQSAGWTSETHFLASAATAMRHALVDAARARLSQKRGERLADPDDLVVAGYSEEETGRILGISDRTVRRDWLRARAWLYRELQG
ncbi:MAG: hypothetical protein EOO54_29275 [Haliea sp.]|nr:MAG: hypothetical protein EOO54_29275 [Haliea sp.]